MPCLHCLWWENLKLITLASSSLSALQGNVIGFKAVKSHLHALTGVSLASWQELPGKPLLRECGWWHGLNPCTQTYMQMHTYSFFLFATTYYDWVQDSLSQKGFGLILETSNVSLSKLREGGQLHRQNANNTTIGSLVRLWRSKVCKGSPIQFITLN